MAWSVHKGTKGKSRKVLQGAPDVCLDQYRWIRDNLKPGQVVEVRDGDGVLMAHAQIRPDGRLDASTGRLLGAE